MKKSIYIFISIIIFVSVLFLFTQNYSFYLNEPVIFNEINEDVDITYIQNGYNSMLDYSLYSMKVKNTVLNSIFDSLLKNSSLLNSKYSNNYIVKVNKETNAIIDKLYWNDKKYGVAKSSVACENGDIYVLSQKYSIDLSQILEENIVKYSKGKGLGKLVYSVKHDSFVNDVNKSIYSMDIVSGKLTWAEYDGSILNVNQYNDDYNIQSKSFKIDSSTDCRPNNILLFANSCYLTFSNNRLYKLNYDNSNLELIKNFNEDKKAVYKIYKLNNDEIILHLHKSFGEEIETYKDGKFTELNLRGLSADLFLKKQYINELSNYSIKNNSAKYIVIFVYLVIIFGVVYIIRFFYLNILKKKIYITFKLVLIILPILFIGNICIAAFTALNNFEMVEHDLFQGKLQTFNDYYMSKINQITEKYDNKFYLGDLLSKVDPYEDIDKSVTEQIYNIMDYGFTDQTFDTNGWYWSVDIVKDKCMYKIIDSELNDTQFFSRYSSGSNAAADRVINGSIYTTTDFNDKYIFCLYPVSDSNGVVTGVVQIGTYYYGFKYQLFEQFYTQSSNRMTIMTTILLIVLVLITFKSLLPLLQLTKKIEAVNSNNIEEIEEIKSNDEIQILTHAFNSMAKNINENMDRMVELNNSYYRFVPLELINLLGKKDIKDVNLGDNIDKNITILCIGINNFYDVMNNNQTGKIFNTMSDIYEYIGPIIRKYGGVIDRFTDRGLIAMFPETVKGAINASVEIVKTIRKMNTEENKFNGINLSCAINVGEVTFGIIGEKKRMQNSAISYTTNYASVIQENSPKLSSDIVISKDALNKLGEADKLMYRYLGKIKFNVINNVLELYDIYEADSDNIKTLKSIYKDEFENAVGKFEQGDYYAARQGFVKILDRNIEEEIARIYFYQSDYKINNSDKEKETGILEI